MSEIIAKTERLLIRTTDSADFDLVLPLFYESEFGSRVKNDEKLRELLRTTSWEEMTQQTTLTGLVFLNSTVEFCGTVSMQKTDRDVPEIGIELLKKHQNCGIGPEAVTVFGNWYCCKYRIPKIMVRIRKENTHSIHVFEKLGAEFLGVSTYFPSDVIDYLKQKLPGQDLSEVDTPSIFNYTLTAPIANQKAYICDLE